MVDIQKHSIHKKHNKQHRKLLDQYQTHFSPLVLPKLAIQGYQLKPDPSCHFFLSQLSLTDKALVNRENQFIDFMKHTFAKSRPELLTTSQKFTLFDFLSLASKQTRLSSQFQENRHRYCEILKLRLKDLNDWIYHVERLHKRPEQEMACRTLIQTQINRLSEKQQSTKRIRNTTLQTKEEGKQYFKLTEFKQLERQKRQLNVKNIYRKNRKANLRNSQLRIITEPNEMKQTYNNLNSIKTRHTETFQDLQKIQLSQTAEDCSLSKKYSKIGSRSSKQKHQLRYSMNHNFEAKFSNKSKQNITVRKSNFIEPVKRQGALVKTGQNPRQRRKKMNTGKSVRYFIEQAKEWPSEDEKTITHKKRGSKASSRGKKQSKSKSSVKSKASTDHHVKATPYAKTSTKNRIPSTVEKESGIVRKTARIAPSVYSSTGKIASQRHSEDQIDIKRQYINARNQQTRPAKMRREKHKISAFFHEKGEQEQIESPKKFHPSSSKNHIRIYRRDGQISQKQHDYSSQNYLQVIPKKKRQGQIVNKQISKHLERLVMEVNLEEMLLKNQLQYQDRFKSKYIFNDPKSRSNKQLTLKDISSISQKHVISNKNNIMMEVDLDAENQQYKTLRNAFLNPYVDSEGLAVDHKELAGVKQDFADMNPYNQHIIAQFYGGNYLKSVDQEFITDQKGKYQFNRNFIQRIKLDIPQHNYSAENPNDPNENLAFQLGISLIQNCQDLAQKQVPLIQHFP